MKRWFSPLAVVVSAALLAPSTSAAQSAPAASAASKFEVASVKRSEPGSTAVSIQAPPGSFIASNHTLRMLIQYAYSIQEFQLIGGPSWIANDRFDITAKTTGRIPNAEVRLMLRALLAERFGVAVHNETRELPVYALVPRSAGKLGPRLVPSSVDCDAVNAERKAQAAGEAPRARPAGGVPPRPVCGTSLRPGRFVAGTVTMAEVTRQLAQVRELAGRLVVDRTELPGKYDIDLDWSPTPLGATDPVAAAGTTGDAAQVTIFTAVQEQLGLKLEAAKAPVAVLVIDGAEPLKEN